MKIKIYTCKKIGLVRIILIIAQCESEELVNDCKLANLNTLAALHQSRLNDINAALENTSWGMVERIEEKP